MKDIKRLLEIRKQQRKKRPAFIRDGYGKRKRIGSEWRAPRGRHSKLRHQFAGHRHKVQPGFRTPEAVRGMDPHGLWPTLVHSLSDVIRMDKSKQSAVIGSSVGKRKRLDLLAELKKRGISVRNVSQNYTEKITKEMAERKAKKSESKKSKKEEKKSEKKEQEASDEEKQAQEKKEKERLLTKAR